MINPNNNMHVTGTPPAVEGINTYNVGLVWAP